MIVLDASAAVELLLNTTLGQEVARLIVDPAETLHAPHLLSIEVSSVVRRLTLAKQIDARTARQALTEFAELGVELYDHEPLLGRIFDLRHNLTSYDAAYVVLADALDADLVTCDAHLAASPSARRARLVSAP